MANKKPIGLSHMPLCCPIHSAAPDLLAALSQFVALHQMGKEAAQPDRAAFARGVEAAYQAGLSALAKADSWGVKS